MIRKDINLSEVIEYYKKNKVASFDEDLDEFGDYFITAGRIAAVILSPTPVAAITNFCSGIDAASLRASKLLSWLPDKFKYKEKGREKFAVDRYELADVVNFMLLQIAITNGVKEVIMPSLSAIIENVKFKESDQKELEKIASECDKETALTKLPLHSHPSKTDFENHSFKIIEPIFSAIIKLTGKCKEEKALLKKFDLPKIKERYLEKVIIYYNAFVINFSSEFPEFALWADTERSGIILKELKDLSKKLETNEKKIHNNFQKQTQILIEKIYELRKPEFIAENGFPSFLEAYEKLFKLQTDKLVNTLNSRIIDNVNAHQNKIKAELNKPLIDNQDIEGIVYPKNGEIFIAQSFRSIIYKRKEHKKGFLTSNSNGDFWEKGENIGNYLLQTLINPISATRPIILLGNPGAGKSMLSKIFAGLLCETTDFIPFLIKLRSVASNTANISEHINKGLSKSIENTADINWLDWAKEFKERIPVVIMDGFDELMQSSNTELNNYINTIKDFQETALNHGICVRVILTSRKTVMQDVFIPEGTKIILLDSFDEKRRNLWVKIWNDNQTIKDYKFAIPKNEKIEHLAQEPLLLFMLAVYDFEKSELQHMTKDRNFNQSKLYDSLLNSFIERQLLKNELYRNANPQQQRREEELFRLRLGMIALMMFLNDTTHKDTQKLPAELETFGLHESKIQTGNILGGFFFIHENKSTTEGEVERLNYEFLHKTFGEFLAADFMLRVALKQCDRSREKICQKYIFKFCFGYNWLHKHYNIQNFLFEYAPQIIKPNEKEHDTIINDIIKPDIEALFENGNIEFPVKENQIQPHKQVVEHLGIYSQNLIFLWLSISKDKEEIKFEIFDSNEKTGDGTGEPKYESQDRDETNRNKLLWKRLAKLWILVGNYNATAKLNEWVKVFEKDNNIILSKQKSTVSHNFSDSASVSCNDFELLLSLFDNEYKFTKEVDILSIINNIIKKKPELSSLAIDSVLHRFHDLFFVFELNLLDWFRNRELSRRQQISLMKKINGLKWNISTTNLVDIIQFINHELSYVYRESPQAIIEYLRMLLDLKQYYPLYEILNQDVLEETLQRILKDFRYIEKENPRITLEYIKLFSELNKYYPYRLNLNGDYLDELLHRLTKDIHYLIRENPYSAFEYLKLLNELRRYCPIGRRIHPNFFEEALFRISEEIQHNWIENPHAILEYLKLVSSLGRYSHIMDKLPPDFYESVLTHLAEEWEHVLRAENFDLLEYLKIIVWLSRYFPIEKIIPSHVIQESFSRIIHDFYYIIQKYPRDADEYFRVMKYLINKCPEQVFPMAKMGNIFDETIHALSQDYKMEFTSNPTILLIYLELVLISGNKTLFKKEKRILDQLVEFILRRDYGNRFFQKATLLLIRYNADQSLIEHLLKDQPKLKNIFLNSPEMANDIMEAMNELTTDENYN
jgi:hypothetical protein